VLRFFGAKAHIGFEPSGAEPGDIDIATSDKLVVEILLLAAQDYSARRTI
jgi:hypothetical protein